MIESHVIEPIAKISSPYRQKFGIPRQSGLIGEAVGWIEFLSPFDQATLVDGLDEFSHLWLVFVFHVCQVSGWRARVRPPRLGGNQRRGVLATRSPFRPNHLGLSVVELLDIERSTKLRLRVGGVDLLDGTPIVDIKPYLPYADARPEARADFAEQKPRPRLTVRFASRVQAQLIDRPELRCLIRKTLELDPRPAYHVGADKPRRYGLQLADVDVQFEIFGDAALVTELAGRRAGGPA
jgi:tRNA-Thr(GGU) m(6)t(6)A37 methyltransferase TsaA